MNLVTCRQRVIGMSEDYWIGRKSE